MTKPSRDRYVLQLQKDITELRQLHERIGHALNEREHQLAEALDRKKEMGDANRAINERMKEMRLERIRRNVSNATR